LSGQTEYSGDEKIPYFGNMKLFTLILLLFFGTQLMAQDEVAPLPEPPSEINQAPDSTGQETYAFAEEMPQFPGGQAEFNKYLQMNVHYPDSAKKYGREGTVYIYFEVAKDGRIESVFCKRGVAGAPELTLEAIRVIQGMPNWTPGYMNGKAVRVSMTVPIRFVLSD